LANCQSPTKKIEYLRSKINEAQQATQEKRREANDNNERHVKAKWAISLSIHRGIYIEKLWVFSLFNGKKLKIKKKSFILLQAEELEAGMKEEAKK
jgi:hypothetical protein